MQHARWAICNAVPPRCAKCVQRSAAWMPARLESAWTASRTSMPSALSQFRGLPSVSCARKPRMAGKGRPGTRSKHRLSLRHETGCHGFLCFEHQRESTASHGFGVFVIKSVNEQRQIVFAVRSSTSRSSVVPGGQAPGLKSKLRFACGIGVFRVKQAFPSPSHQHWSRKDQPTRRNQVTQFWTGPTAITALQYD
jgi:hypothetical protein